jgi:hypothetical protein
MTLERHSVYLVPPRSSISSSSIAVDGGGKHGGERGGASQEKDGQNGTGNGSVVEASPNPQCCSFNVHVQESDNDASSEISLCELEDVCTLHLHHWDSALCSEYRVPGLASPVLVLFHRE